MLFISVQVYNSSQTDQTFNQEYVFNKPFNPLYIKQHEKKDNINIKIELYCKLIISDHRKSQEMFLFYLKQLNHIWLYKIRLNDAKKNLYISKIINNNSS